MIRVHELTKRFPGPHGREVVAVDRLSFEVKAGEVYGLLGPNGAGKTSTIRMILGLLQPTSGYAEVDGLRTLDAPDEVKRRIGLVSTSAGLYQWLTVREELLFFADVYGTPQSEAEATLERLADLLGFRDLLDRRCAHLSTGQKQRIQLARALIHDPPIMLLDEPTRGLDVFGTHTIFEYIATLRRQGKSVILSTHRLDEAQRICDRVGLMHHGRLWREGSLPELQAATGRETLVEMFMETVHKTSDGGVLAGAITGGD